MTARAEQLGAQREGNEMDDETIDRALRAMDRALTAGRDMRSAMRAALLSVSSTGLRNEFAIELHGVELLVGFSADIEDEWIITAAPGADLAPLLLESDLAGRIDVLVVAEMAREAARNAADALADQHAAQRAHSEVL
jgi:hypothetical protein